MSKADYCVARGRYHARWCARYSLAGLACFVASVAAIPDRRGLFALAIGYAFYALAGRERRLARRIFP